MRVIVVGAGVIGCSAAVALARRGADVLVVERGVAGSGASGAAAGHYQNGVLLAGWTGEHMAAAMLDGASLPGVVAPGRFKAAVAR